MRTADIVATHTATHEDTLTEHTGSCMVIGMREAFKQHCIAGFFSFFFLLTASALLSFMDALCAIREAGYKDMRG